MDNTAINQFIEDHEGDMIEMRRYLHQHPEVSLEEYETTKYLARELDKLGLDYRLLEPTGLVTEISGPEPGKIVLLRADIDALPIQQTNAVAYVSKNEGVMHACGHDTHMSMMFLALRALLKNKDQIKGTVRFIFQAAEENAQGARLAIEQGVMEGVDNVFGIHINSKAPTQMVSSPDGPSHAAADRFVVKFTGKGGHAAHPHMSQDAMVMQAQFILAVQTLVSRETDPLKSAVITVGEVQAGDRFNIIAETARLEGTVRTYEPGVRDHIESRMRTMAEDIASMNQGQADFHYDRLTEPVFNDTASAGLAKSVALDLFGEDHYQEVPPSMGAEDFGFYMEQVPGVFITIGSRAGEDTAYPHHHSKFDIDESAMIMGAKMHANYALAYLNQGNF